MVVVDEETQRFVEEDGEPYGRLYDAVRMLTARYDVIEPEESEMQVVAEYPNGGKDVRRVVTKPEVGVWRAFDVDGSDVSHLFEVPESAKEQGRDRVRFSVGVKVLHRYTPEEIEEMRREEEEKQRVESKFRSMEDGLASTDDAICELYEKSLADDAIIDEQDAAICALYEMMEA